jgi:hypothetical protein
MCYCDLLWLELSELFCFFPPTNKFHELGNLDNLGVLFSSLISTRTKRRSVQLAYMCVGSEGPREETASLQAISKPLCQ